MMINDDDDVNLLLVKSVHRDQREQVYRPILINLQ